MNLTRTNLRNNTLQAHDLNKELTVFENINESLALAILFMFAFLCIRKLFLFKRYREKTLLPLKVEIRNPKLDANVINYYNEEYKDMPYKRKTLSAPNSPTPILTSTKSFESFSIP